MDSKWLYLHNIPTIFWEPDNFMRMHMLQIENPDKHLSAHNQHTVLYGKV